jgi:hypothetical protein
MWMGLRASRHIEPAGHSGASLARGWGFFSSSLDFRDSFSVVVRWASLAILSGIYAAPDCVAIFAIDCGSNETPNTQLIGPG